MPPASDAPPEPSVAPTDIAIIGMACRFPGASSPDAFWRLLAAGAEARTTLSDDELRAEGVSERLIADPHYVKAGMFLPAMEQFDPSFFGFSPIDGRILDPQHRHFLECTWEALEDAGYDPFRFRGSIGVFAGSGQHSYFPQHLLANPELLADVGTFLLRHTGNDKDFLTTRVSYCFDLTGPSVNVQTACSTSLVAVHTAVQSLIGGECEMALAGGVTIELPHRHGYLWRDGEILSPDGHCRPFDASAGGTVFGSGVGVVVLKRLGDALADGDQVHAVIKGSAVNNDGAGKVSYLAPSVDGQAAVIREALSVSGIDAASVSYIETHGTGTPIGDPIEVAALTQGYAVAGTDQRIAIGSVKSNIGHLDTAAGIASLIKVVLAMRARQLPPTLHYRAANPAIDFAAGPFHVNTELRPWGGPTPLRAGVSSLGVGGTNAHVLLEEPPAPRAAGRGRPLQLLPLSARSTGALQRARHRLSEWLDERAADGQALRPAPPLADVAWTLATGRREFRHRGFVVAGSDRDAVRALDEGSSAQFVRGEAPATAPRVAFLLAGGGAQYPEMGRGLYDTEPVYRAVVDECLAILREVADLDLRALLLPDESSPDDRETRARSLERPSRTLPALFITQYAQARLWEHWGIVPAALLGHSMGENTAACLAGVLSLRDAIGLVALRGRLFETVPPGGMLSVELDESALLPRLGSALSLAAVNAPGFAVASGATDALQQLEAALAADGIGATRIRIDIAAHSAMLDPILPAFRAYLQSVTLRPPRIPMLSNVTGSWLGDADATDPEYWVRHLRQTVRFADGVGTLVRDGGYALLEVGPGRTLATLAGQHPEKRPAQAILTSLRHPDESTPDLHHMLSALGRLWVAGVAVDWARLHATEGRQRVSLPTYPFEHARCWVERGAPSASDASTAAASAAGRASDLQDWCYQPAWRRIPIATAPELRGARILLLASSHPASAAVAARLRAAGGEVRVARGGTQPAGGDATDATLRWEVGDDYVHLATALEGAGWHPTHVVHLLSLDLTGEVEAPVPAVTRARAFDSLFHLAQAAGRDDWRDVRWLVVGRHVVSVGGEAVHSALPGLLLGALRVLPNEFPGWRGRFVDVDHALVDVAPTLLGDRLACELAAMTTVAHDDVPANAVPVVALRGASRFVQHFAPAPPVEGGASQAHPVRPHGVYLVTGGTGGLGMIAAERLAAHGPVVLVLLARRALSEREHWDALIAQGAPEAALLQRLRALEALGATVRLEAGDVADAAAMERLAARLRADVGLPHGIVHTAGVLDDAPLLTRDVANAARVLSAKVDGTIILDRVFGGERLDFFVSYSSISACAGLPGQFDYAAANAFLDAYAHRRQGEGAPMRAIGWPAWRDTGMVAALAPGAAGTRLPAGRPLAHPFLQRCTHESATAAAFATRFDASRDWVVGEHRLRGGPALLPGAGFLELAAAASLFRRPEATAIEVRDAAFEAPFLVPDGEGRVLRVSLEGAADGGAFVLTSGEDDNLVEHARGYVAPTRPLQASLDLAGIRERCRGPEQHFDDPDHHPFLEFGERWASLRRVQRTPADATVHEALITLAVDDRFAGELAQFRLHPALLDMASAGAQCIIPDYRPQEEFFVPIGYRRLVSNGPFPARCWSHVRHVPVVDAVHGREIARFDITVADESGRVFLVIEDFAMRRLRDTSALRSRERAPTAEAEAARARALELGLSSAEGGEVLEALLRRPAEPHLLVSPHPLATLLYVTPTGGPASAVRASAAPAHDPDADPVIPQLEQALAACAAVRQVAVRAFGDAGSERRLVAFFLPDFDHFVTLGDVRRFARQVLPAELVPQQFVEVDELALGDDGQLARAALLDPSAPRDTFVAPRTATERALARIWLDALGVERVGLSDNFFDLGGHSLLSIRVIVQTAKKLGVRLDQATMVLSTLAQVAQEIDERRTAEGPVVATGGAEGGGDGAAGGSADGSATADTTTAAPRGRGLLRFLRGS
jgi:acyl transferase domain-containing protein